ncbi:DNA polymerase III subunit chi [Lutibaculum baratangense]|uniref:DNA polymerase III chi subunit n=1 Tax=Lutibaculum baratangense AMV1 TaxID=631454 RepID=V4RMF8_9HYPH|nr:DNA polymerase III subunit chi [Lutibaculum baratangense]ESR27221.1 DNA polymerase III chi subunit [Lutibaculum baratangense AMV1]
MEVFFYHLEKQPLEAALPLLVEKSLERGWRVVVQCGSEERLEQLDGHLWAYDDSSFLPHGSDREADAALQPALITTSEGNVNGAAIRFLVDGARLDRLEGYERLVFMFDGRDEAAVEQARAEWRRAKDGGLEVTYWRQAPNGRWERKA